MDTLTESTTECTHLVFRYVPAENRSCSLCDQPHPCRVALACFQVFVGDARERETCLEVCPVCLERHGRQAVADAVKRFRDEMVAPWEDDTSPIGRQELRENRAVWDPVVALAVAGRMTVPALLPATAFALPMSACAAVLAEISCESSDFLAKCRRLDTLLEE